MRIHTDLTLADIMRIPTLPTVTVRITEYGSQSRTRAFEVVLTGSSVHGGQYGTTDYKTATWDEWGVWLGHLFQRDPTARISGVYEGAGDFHYLTNDRYHPGHQLTLCPRHRWVYVSPYHFECAKCGAEKTNHRHAIGDVNRYQGSL